MRLIDADTIFNNELLLVSDKAYDAVHAVIERINNAPTVDAVEVVRCKDCFHFWDGVCKAHIDVIYVDDNDFCSFGERRED